MYSDQREFLEWVTKVLRHPPRFLMGPHPGCHVFLSWFTSSQPKIRPVPLMDKFTKSSIESEPRTLRMDQIHFAREAALYVLKTRPLEEAMRIFTEGLEPVVTVVGLKKGTLRNEFEFAEVDHLEHSEELLRDVVTAPF